MLASSIALGLPKIARAGDLCIGNTNINTIFCSEIFNLNHGMEPLEDDQKFESSATPLDDEIDGTIEERQYRMWINSLNI